MRALWLLFIYFLLLFKHSIFIIYKAFSAYSFSSVNQFIYLYVYLFVYLFIYLDGVSAVIDYKHLNSVVLIITVFLEFLLRLNPFVC